MDSNQLKDRKKDKIIIILSVIVLFLSMLCVYFTFFNKENKSNDTTIKEKA